MLNADNVWIPPVEDRYIFHTQGREEYARIYSQLVAYGAPRNRAASSDITADLAAKQEQHANRLAGSVVYRIYTEDVADYDYARLVDSYFPGATMFTGVGLWQGQRESSRIIEIVGTRADLQGIAFLADALKHETRQTSVLVTSSPITVLSW